MTRSVGWAGFCCLVSLVHKCGALIFRYPDRFHPARLGAIVKGVSLHGCGNLRQFAAGSDPRAR
jgi:hypothetical protein